MSVHPIPLPTAATPLADYLRQEWLPRHEPTWASGSRRHRRWTVAILCDSPLADRPIGDLGVLEIERYFAEWAGQPFPQKGQLPARGPHRTDVLPPGPPSSRPSRCRSPGPRLQ
jgi:hypothetical protein